MELRWEPKDRHSPDILCLRMHWDELARVKQRVDDVGWLSEVARHRPDWRRRLHVLAPTRQTAMQWAERWTLIHLERIRAEIPPLRMTHCGTRSSSALRHSDRGPPFH